MDLTVLIMYQCLLTFPPFGGSGSISKRTLLIRYRASSLLTAEECLVVARKHTGSSGDAALAVAITAAFNSA
jgi:hypothetical protein